MIKIMFVSSDHRFHEKTAEMPQVPTVGDIVDFRAVQGKNLTAMVTMVTWKPFAADGDPAAVLTVKDSSSLFYSEGIPPLDPPTNTPQWDGEMMKQKQ